MRSWVRPGSQFSRSRKLGNELDVESLAAAAIIVFIAGYDATAQTMQYAFHALALHQVLLDYALKICFCNFAGMSRGYDLGRN